MEYLDICDENGIPTGKTVSREQAHREGILHRTAHVWIARKTPGGHEVLLQKRSLDKESYPGLWDTSSAGHIPAGEEPLPSALREMKEELGLSGSDVEDLTLRYITVRMVGGEIRQNYYFFGRLTEDRPLKSTEGSLRWVPLAEIPALEMPLSAKHMILHYLEEGRFTDQLYCGVTERGGTKFIPMKDFPG